MKLVKIDTCKNLFCILLFFVTFFSIIVFFSNAYGEPLNVNSLSNSSQVQDLNKTTNSHSLSENIIDNKKANQLTEKFFAQIKQINDTKAVIEVFPITFDGAVAVIKNDTNSSQFNLLSLHKNDTFQEVNNTEFLPPPPPLISYIENEGDPMNATNFLFKDSDRNASEEEDEDESSRNASEEEDEDESSRNASEEEDEDESSRNASEEEDEDESSRNASEEEDEDESSRNASEEEDEDESSRNASEEEDEDESSRNASEEEDEDESSRNASEEEDEDESSRNASEEEDEDESSRNASEEEDEDESSRNASEEEDEDESSRNASEEEDEDESSRNASEEEDEDESSRNASEEEDEDESSRNASEEEDEDESSRNASEEEDEDESSRNASEENTRAFYYKKSNVVSNNELIGNKTIGNSIDNENDKLISQFSELNSSVIPNLQIQIDDSNSKTNDRKPIANAGLDQVITTDQNIVLDASASFDPEGKISSYLWKQTGNSEGKIKSSNSMIYSFPIPEGLEEKSLEFKLIVVDEKGQKDTDTINFLLNQENDEESKT